MAMMSLALRKYSRLTQNSFVQNTLSHIDGLKQFFLSSENARTGYQGATYLVTLLS
jgi:hypothetical protein